MTWQFYAASPGSDYIGRNSGGVGIGPLPAKRWKRDGKKYKLAYRWKTPPFVTAENSKEWHERKARQYIDWLIKRDGIKVPITRGVPHVEKIIWSGVYQKTGRRTYERRVQAIAWGHEESVYAQRKDGRQGAFQCKRFVENFRIEIPNWDFQSEITEEVESPSVMPSMFAAEYAAA